jgi:hypothetical protein
MQQAASREYRESGLRPLKHASNQTNVEKGCSRAENQDTKKHDWHTKQVL